MPLTEHITCRNRKISFLFSFYIPSLWNSIFNHREQIPHHRAIRFPLLKTRSGCWLYLLFKAKLSLRYPLAPRVVPNKLTLLRRKFCNFNQKKHADIVYEGNYRSGSTFLTYTAHHNDLNDGRRIWSISGFRKVNEKIQFPGWVLAVMKSCFLIIMLCGGGFIVNWAHWQALVIFNDFHQKTRKICLRVSFVLNQCREQKHSRAVLKTLP